MIETVLVVCLLGIGVSPPAKSGDEPSAAVTGLKKKEPKAAAKGPTWLTSFSEASATARKSNRPLLVKVDAEFCVWCKKLDEELAKPEVASKLASFVLVKLDVARDPDESQKLNVAGTP